MMATLWGWEPALVRASDPPLGTTTRFGVMANSLRVTGTGPAAAEDEPPPPSGLVAATTPTMIRANIEVTTAKRDNNDWLTGDKWCS